MRQDADRGKVVLALKRAIAATFNKAQWLELGYMTNCQDIVEGHPRLLRSLDYSDEDYDGNALVVVRDIVRRSEDNIPLMEDFIGLEQWLFDNDRRLYGDLYSGAEVVSFAQVEAAGQVLGVAELHQHATRIRKAIESDPAQAIGSAKELLETTLKAVLGERNYERDADIPALLKKVRPKLGLDPRDVDPTFEGAATIRRTLSNLGQIVVGVAEVRNLHGTGHGRVKSRDLEVAHARLVVNAAITLATYLLEMWRGLRGDQIGDSARTPPE